MGPLVGLIVIIVLLGILLGILALGALLVPRLLGGSGKGEAASPPHVGGKPLLAAENEAEEEVSRHYVAEPSLLTPAERSFLGVLEQALEGRCRAMAKVRLTDTIRVRPGLDASERQRCFNRIQSKHLDFVLCRPADFAILAAIELDDGSHARSDRQRRDAFVDDALAAAGIPLLRFEAKRAYQVAEIAGALQEALAERPETVGDPAPASTAPGPCPACGGELVLRTASRGANAGQQFYGCSNYPRCRTVVPVEGK